VLDALLAEARLRWGFDASAGLQLVVAERLIATPIEASRPLIIVPAGALGLAPAGEVEPLPGRNGPTGRDPLDLLGRLYPADHPIGRFGRPAETTIATLGLDDLAGPLYVGPVAPELAAAGPWAMPWIAWRLRLPDGCPWDREQTHASLRKHLLEEAYEVYDALADGPTPALAGELGDLLLQVILHAQLAAEAGSFDLTDVQANLTTKIVRRHPHVFGTAEAQTAADVNRQWERIKAAERAEAVDSSGGSGDGSDGRSASLAAPAGAGSDARPAPKSALDGISRSMPALAASQEMQERAAALGYDWPAIEGILAKLHEELGELLAADSDAEREEELGDLLMVVVNLGRRQGIEAEAALRQANDKFRRRFASVERQAHDRGVALRDLDFDGLDELWKQAKVEEHEAGGTPLTDQDQATDQHQEMPR
jgi:tetrapyrrole methylase family protein / MazG family protein